MLTKNLSPSIEVVCVTNDSTLHIGVQELAQASVVPTFLKDVERNPTLTLVLWLLDVLPFKKDLQLLLSNSEDVLLGYSRSLLISTQERLFEYLDL